MRGIDFETAVTETLLELSQYLSVGIIIFSVALAAIIYRAYK